MAESARRNAPLWVETLVLLVVAVVLALVIKTFFVQAFYIPSESMRPGLNVNDRILVQKVSYWFGGSPDRGDVVVFEDPGGWLSENESEPTGGFAKVLAKIGLYPTGGHLVKRVIGVEGDTVECCDDKGRIKVNGQPLDESDFIVEQQKCDGPMPNQCAQPWSVGPIPAGKIFVMGDNRGESADSSAHMDSPYVPTDLVVGKVFALVWPLKHLDWVGTPKTFEDVPDPK